METKSINTRQISCDSCRFCDKRSVTTWYCKQCGEGMCDQCQTTHSRIKALFNHTTILMNSCIESQEKEDFGLDGYVNTRTHSENKEHTFCLKHDDTVDQYCQDCNIMVCNECIKYDHTNHATVLLSKITEESISEISKYSSILKKRIELLVSTINTIRENEECYSRNIQQLKSKILSRGEKLKHFIDELMTELFTDLRKTEESDKKEQENIRIETEKYKLELEDLVRSCEENMKNHTRTVEYLSELRDRLKNIPDFSYFETKHVPELSCPDKMERTLLQGMLGTLKTVEIGKDTDKEKVTTPCADLLQNMLYSTTIVSSFKLPKQAYRVYNVDSKYALVVERYPHKEIFKVTKDGNVLNTITSDELVYDIVILSNEVFLTSGNCVRKVTTTGNFETLVNFSPFYSKGLGFADKDLLVCLYRPGKSQVVRLTTTGDTVQTLQYDGNQIDLFQKPQYVAYNNVSKDVCVVDDNKVLVVVDINGKIKFKYKGPVCEALDKNVHFYGVICDSLGNIVLSDRDNNAIHQLDKNGQFLRFFLTQKNGIREPIGICISTIGELWICNRNGETVVVIKYLS